MAKRGRDYGIPGESVRTKRMSVQKLRKRVLTVFQKLRRIEEADEDGWCECCTCGAIAQWDDGMHGGHYVSRSHNSAAFLDVNVHAQCVLCNAYNGGKEAEHRAYIAERYGEDVAAELDRLKNETVQIYRVDYLEMLKDFNERLKAAKERFK